MNDLNLTELENNFQRDILLINSIPWPLLRVHLLNRLIRGLSKSLQKNQLRAYTNDIIPLVEMTLAELLESQESYFDISPFQLIQLRKSLFHWINSGLCPALAGETFITDLTRMILHQLFRLQAWDQLQLFMADIPQLIDFYHIANERSALENTPSCEITGSQFAEFIPVMYQWADIGSEKSWQSDYSNKTLKVMLQVSAGDYSAGISGTLSLERVETSRHLHLDQIRIATHLVDESDILAEQSRVLCRFLRKEALLEKDLGLRLEYALDQPSTSLVGSSIGLAMALLSMTGLKSSLKNRPLQLMMYQDVAITGAIDGMGNVLPVDSNHLPQKIEAAFYSRKSYMVVPVSQIEQAQSAVDSLRKTFPNNNLKLIAVNRLEEVTQRREICFQQRRKLVERFTQFFKQFGSAALYMFSGVILLVTFAFYFGIVRHSVPMELILRDNYYSVVNRFGYTLWNTEPEASNAVIIDLDNDGEKEILLTYSSKGEIDKRSKLYCYDKSGSIDWELYVGKDVTYGNTTYSELFSVSIIITADIDNDLKQEIILVCQFGLFPNQFLLLNHEGTILSEYWHSGGFQDVAVDDVFPGNDVKEIIACGTNNEFGSGVLIILDPMKMSGQSPQVNPHFLQKGIESGNEIFYIRLPKTHFSEFPEREYARHLSIRPEGTIKLFSGTNGFTAKFGYDGHVIYIFDTEMKLIYSTKTDDYFKLLKMVYPESYRSLMNESDFKTRFDNVLYWNGTDWVSTPAINQNYTY